MAPQDGMLQDVIIEKPNGAAMRRALKAVDPNEVLVWDSLECLDQFHALVANPPLHSLVVHIEPVVAKKLLDIANDLNRPLTTRHAARLGKQIATEDYGLTGDTLKFSKIGRMLDGQHRLTGCAEQSKPIISHVVFGLDDGIFDIIDQGRKRTPGDVLARCGLSHATMVAGAVRWVHALRAQTKGTGGRDFLTPRQIKIDALGPMRGVNDFTNEAALINQAFKQPPTFIAALLFLISKHSKLVAEDFANSWVSGARIGRNKNFDVLQQRLQTVRNQSGGTLNRTVNAAMVVQCFNHWHAGVVAAPRALTWRSEWVFPALAFDKDDFLKARDAAIKSSTTLQDMQQRMLETLDRLRDKDGNVQVPYRRLGVEANINERHVSYILSTLRKESYVHLSKQGKPGATGKDTISIWRLRPAGEARVRSTFIKAA